MGAGWGGGRQLREGVVAVMSVAASTATASIKYLKGDNQPAQVELVALQQAVTAAQCSFSGESNCQRKVLEVKKTIM